MFHKIIKIQLMAGIIFALSGGVLGNRFAVDGISYYSPYYNLNARDTKLLKLGSYIQTTHYTCGPAAVMNLLYYYKRLNGHDLTRSTEMRIAREMGTTMSGTSQSQVKAWLNQNGFKVYSGKLISADTIKANIDNGIPTMLIFDQHWLLASGYSNKNSSTNNDIIFTDTESGTTIIPSKYIDTMWARYQLSHRGKIGNPGYFLVAVPR